MIEYGGKNARVESRLPKLSPADQKRFADQLLKPKKPNAPMKRAAKRHAAWIEPS